MFGSRYPHLGLPEAAGEARSGLLLEVADDYRKSRSRLGRLWRAPPAVMFVRNGYEEAR